MVRTHILCAVSFLLMSQCYTVTTYIFWWWYVQYFSFTFIFCDFISPSIEYNLLINQIKVPLTESREYV